MADSTILPGQRAALIDGNGVTSPEFYRFFRSLSVTAELPARVGDLTVRVAALEDGRGDSIVTTTGIVEGVNLYFTKARALAVVDLATVWCYA